MPPPTSKVESSSNRSILEHIRERPREVLCKIVADNFNKKTHSLQSKTWEAPETLPSEMKQIMEAKFKALKYLPQNTKSLYEKVPDSVKSRFPNR
ncbi:hypothetical protein BDQ12DRAFT_725249 [Crucibulum laeve]|uniref:Uncharacterized protein n=1 Tax=Crucibulum laeve TaxID=68775 RepID=A0A5C3LST6_9AGAR|nr:hypothetical protein BDQ12DRAFT_725249 [Crucibulum laeve]